MIDLKLITSIDKQLSKVRQTTIHSNSIFCGLSLMVIMADFYQFEHLCGHKKEYKKSV